VRRRALVPGSDSRRGFFLALGALAVVCSTGGPRLFVLLVYQRGAILHGQVWRLLTCHLVHAGPAHLLWNLVGTALVGLALGHALRVKEWLAASVTVALGSSLGVLILQPDVRVVSGLSALLHGLLAAGAAAEARRGERVGWVFLIVLAVKVAWEQITGPTALTRAVLGGGIAVGAHAFGGLAGVLAGVALGRLAGPDSSGASAS
jgi:rhomboid family GlyGly-CTERM serine protease